MQTIPNRITALLCSLVLIISVNSVSATKRYVSPSGNDNTGNGTIGLPYRTIQKGINVSVAGDSVMAQPGTYTGAIVMSDDVAIVGSGYATTTIDGNGATVIVDAATALIQGFTIRNGETAIQYDSLSSPTVLSNFITEVYYGFDGYIPYQTGPITPILRFNIFETMLWGINLDEQAFADGGVNATIENNTLLPYQGAQFNTGIRYRMHQSLPTIYANTIVGNKNGIEFTYMTIFDQRKALVSCNNVWDNETNYWTEGVNDLTGFQGNISVNPDFCNQATGDYRLYNTSPNTPTHNSCGILIGAFDVGCTTKCGDADNNGVYTVSDAVFLITYIFAGGPRPMPYLGGDADCNGLITISDAVYMIGYIFGGGPAPCAGC